MKLTPSASLYFKKGKPSAKVAFGANVINALSVTDLNKKIAGFAITDLPIPVADLQAINDELSAAVSEALTGNHAAVANVKNVVQQWNDAFYTNSQVHYQYCAGRCNCNSRSRLCAY